MINRTRTIVFAIVAAFTTTAARAHAFLEHAVPSVGSTVSRGPADLELSYTQDVVLALCNVTVASAAGGVAASRPTGTGNTIHVRLGRPLSPGTYTVTWHVVSVDTHPTSGTYRFTVAP